MADAYFASAEFVGSRQIGIDCPQSQIGGAEIAGVSIAGIQRP